MERLLVTAAGGRQVHVRRHGRGPALVLLHESPETSEQYLGLMEQLGDAFTCLAPDLPGRGLSDPFPAGGPAPTIARYAAATAEALAALGLRGPVPVFGTHTGALVALELACAHPQHVALAILDGTPLLADAEARELADRFAPPIGLEEDGTHLLRAWDRLRSLGTWFPWYARDEAHRLARPLPPAAHLHRQLLAMLRTGEDYRLPYAAAFAHRPLQRLPHARAPLAFLCREGDLQQPVQGRLPEERRAEVLAPGPWLARLGELAGGAAQTPAPAAGGNGFALTVEGQLRVRRGTESGRPVVLLPGEPDGARRVPLDGVALAVDLPSSGDSDVLAGAAALTAEEAAARAAGAAAQVLEAEGLAGVELRASGAAMRVAAALTVMRPDLAARVVERPRPPLAGPPPHPLELAPDLDGVHLVRAWRAAADSLLWSPWWERRPEHRTAGEWSAAEAHERALALLLGGTAWQELERALTGGAGGG